MTCINRLACALLPALIAAAPAAAWTRTVVNGAYSITATMGTRAGGRASALSVGVARGNAAATGAMVHAWFLDPDGLILGPAALPPARAGRNALTTQASNLLIPREAAALAVLVQPAPGAPPLQAGGDIYAQFTLPAEARPV